MKSNQFFLLIFLSLCFISCTDSLADFGSGIKPQSDQVLIAADTFRLKSFNDTLSAVVSYPDSCLLGKFYNSVTGTMKGEILAQLNCSEGFKYHTNMVPDSAFVDLGFLSWYGDPYAPMRVSVYQMDKGSLDYQTPYYTNIDPDDYVSNLSESGSLFLGASTFTLKDAMEKRSDTTRVSIPLSNALLQKLKDDSKFSSTETFLNYFKGIYLTTDFGSASIMNVNLSGGLSIRYHYHYRIFNSVADSFETVKRVQYFPANKLVRQVNRIRPLDRKNYIKDNDSLNFIMSPANCEMRITVPLRRIQQRMNSNSISTGKTSKDQYLNSALMKVHVVELTDTADVKTTLPSYLLLVKENFRTKFFKSTISSALNDTCAILGTLSYSTTEDDDGNVTYHYYYGFELNAMLQNTLHEFTSLDQVPQDLSLKLLPVDVTYSSSSVSAVKPSMKFKAATVRNGNYFNDNKHSESLDLKLVFSTF